MKWLRRPVEIWIDDHTVVIVTPLLLLVTGFLFGVFIGLILG